MERCEGSSSCTLNAKEPLKTISPSTSGSASGSTNRSLSVVDLAMTACGTSTALDVTGCVTLNVSVNGGSDHPGVENAERGGDTASVSSSPAACRPYGIVTVPGGGVPADRRTAR